MSLKQRTALMVLGWFLVGTGLTFSTVAAQDVAPAPASQQLDSSSPSQEVRERIEQIRRNEFFYQSYGKMDPFTILVSGDYEAVSGAELVDLNSAKLVGVMWGTDDRFALVEDGDGFGYILRVGDRILNGRVLNIRDDSLSARIALYGIANTVVLKLDRTEG
jgi:hypothetical protein